MVNSVINIFKFSYAFLSQVALVVKNPLANAKTKEMQV